MAIHSKSDNPKASKSQDAIVSLPLSEKESEDFARLDGVVTRGLNSIIEAATALEEIRNRRLYRTEFPLFEAYCQQRFNLTRQYANRLIKAGRIRLEMETFVSKEGLNLELPSREAILRELGRVEGAEAKIEIYEEAVGDVGGTPSAADVKRLVDGRLGVTDSLKQDKLAPLERVQRAMDLIDELESEAKAGVVTVEQFINWLREALSSEMVD